MSACTMLRLPVSHKVAFKYLARIKIEETYQHGVWPGTSLRVGAVCCSVIRNTRARYSAMEFSAGLCELLPSVEYRSVSEINRIQIFSGVCKIAKTN